MSALSSDRPKPFVEHLEDLRWTIVRCLGWMIAAILSAVPLAPHVIRALKRPVAIAGRDPEHFLRVFTVSAGLSLALQTIFWTGMVIGMPFVAFEIARFVFPGLKQTEKRVFLVAGTAAIILFVSGAVLAYFAALPVAIRCFLQVNDWMGIPCEFVDMRHYITLSLQILAAFGLAFEIPIIIFALGVIGLVNTGHLRRFRRGAVVGLAALAMVITPSTDPLTMILLTCVLAALYELCILSLAAFEKSRSTTR